MSNLIEAAAGYPSGPILRDVIAKDEGRGEEHRAGEGRDEQGNHDARDTPRRGRQQKVCDAGEQNEGNEKSRGETAEESANPMGKKVKIHIHHGHEEEGEQGAHHHAAHDGLAYGPNQFRALAGTEGQGHHAEYGGKGGHQNGPQAAAPGLDNRLAYCHLPAAEQIDIVHQYDAVVHRDAHQHEQAHRGEHRKRGIDAEDRQIHDAVEKEHAGHHQGDRKEDNQGIQQGFEQCGHDAVHQRQGSGHHHHEFQNVSVHIGEFAGIFHNHIILEHQILGDCSANRRVGDIQVHPGLQPGGNVNHPGTVFPCDGNRAGGPLHPCDGTHRNPLSGGTQYKNTVQIGNAPPIIFPENHQYIDFITPGTVASGGFSINRGADLVGRRGDIQPQGVGFVPIDHYAADRQSVRERYPGFDDFIHVILQNLFNGKGDNPGFIEIFRAQSNVDGRSASEKAVVGDAEIGGRKITVAGTHFLQHPVVGVNLPFKGRQGNDEYTPIG